MYRIAPIRFVLLLFIHLYVYIVCTNWFATHPFASTTPLETITRPDIRPLQLIGFSAYLGSLVTWGIFVCLWCTHGRSRIPLVVIWTTSVLLVYIFTFTNFFIVTPNIATCWVYPGNIWFSISNGCNDTLWSMPLAQTLLASYGIENTINRHRCVYHLVRVCYVACIVATTVMSVQTTLGCLFNTFVLVTVLVTHPTTLFVAKKLFLVDVRVYDRLSALESI